MKNDQITQDIARLVELTSADGLWAGLSAGIPSWHPRNETPGAAAAAGASAEGGAAEGVEGGQAGGFESNPLYADALRDVNPELHPLFEETFKKFDASLTPRFQEAAALKERYAPFEGVEGLTETDPETLQGLLEIGQILRDPEARIGWANQLNEALGIQTLDALDEDNWVQLGEANGWFADGEGGSEGEGDPMSAFQQMLDERLGPIQENLSSQAQAQQQAQLEAQKAAETDRITQQYTSDMAEALGTLGEMDDEKKALVSKSIIKLAHAYPDDDDAIFKAFADYQQITGVTEGDRMERRLGQPASPALSGGRPSTAPAKMSWNGDGGNPREAALARMRG
jgi:hypothetical protein